MVERYREVVQIAWPRLNRGESTLLFDADVTVGLKLSVRHASRGVTARSRDASGRLVGRILRGPAG